MRWLRFSLRTLAIFVLLAGSAGALWRNWDPWVVGFSVVEPFPIEEVLFSDDNRLVAFSVFNRTDNYSNRDASDFRQAGVDVREVATGAQHARFKSMSGWEFTFSGDYAFTREQIPDEPAFRLFNWVEGREMPIDKSFVHQDYLHIDVKLARHHLLVLYDQRQRLYRLPGFEIEHEWIIGKDAPHAASFLNNESLLIYAQEKYAVFTPSTGITRHLNGVTPKDLNSQYRPNRPFIAVNVVQTPSNDSFRLLDTVSGNASERIEGSLLDATADMKLALIESTVYGCSQLIDVATRKPLMNLEGNNDQFSPDGRMIVDPNGCVIYDVNEKRLLWRGEEGWAAFNPTSEFIENNAGLYDARSGCVLQNLHAVRSRS